MVPKLLALLDPLALHALVMKDHYLMQSSKYSKLVEASRRELAELHTAPRST